MLCGRHSESVSELDSKTLADIKSPGLAERLRALHDLWATIPEEYRAPPLSEADRRILDASLAWSDAHPGDSISLDELLEEMAEVRRSAS